MRILHVGVGNLGAGGVATYVSSVVDALRMQAHDVMLCEIWTGPKTLPGVQAKLDRVEEIGELATEFRADVVHLHSQLPHYRGIGKASLITAHEHTSHCPAGARYLEAPRQICTRDFGWLNCLRGHYIDRCGSRNFSSVRRRMSITANSADFPGQWIAPATFSRDWLLRRGMPTERVHLIHNPGPRPSGTPPVRHPGSKHILYMGRLVGNKGVDVLLQAMRELPEATLSILGDGPERGKLEALSRSLGLEQRVNFEGWVDSDAVASTCRDATVLAIPSLWPEPFGLVALEAARDYLPVVASSVGGLKDVIVDGKTGLLVPPGDPSALAQALGQILSDEPRARTMGERAARRSNRRFSMNIHLHRLVRLYERAANGDQP